ncbi:MAG: PDGLE domain-containing protein [Ardenticatenaceae bacterium]|nr:PDGLE domain-containing protein [Ardenticatenaceae bacterium]
MNVMLLPAAAQLMHIPDGFLSLAISLICWGITAVFLALAIRNAQEAFDERLIPLAGIMAAFIFAGQMINFPVAGGTSGHLIGATLAFIVLGPSLGLLAMAAVIILQALLFQDGGLVVMGANLIGMGIVPGYAGYAIYQFWQKRGGRMQLAAAGVGAWVAIMMAALVVALLLSFSGTTSLAIAVPAMLGVHALIGIGEALITVAALAFIRQTRPQLLSREGEAQASNGWIAGGIAVAILVALFSPLASASPDGLESVAQQAGFLGAAQDAPFQLLPDYTIPVLGDGGASTIAAGIIGVLVVAGLMYTLTRNLRKPSE